MTSFRRPIIGLAGPAGVGKSTVARALAELHPGAVIHPFAGPIKAFIAAIGAADWPKEQPAGHLCGLSPREVMQRLGTEFGRRLIGADFWVRVWDHTLPPDAPVVIVDDVRFQNEVEAIWARGGHVFRLTRDAPTTAHAHESETQDICVNHRIDLAGLTPAEAAAEIMRWVAMMQPTRIRVPLADYARLEGLCVEAGVMLRCQVCDALLTKEEARLCRTPEGHIREACERQETGIGSCRSPASWPVVDGDHMVLDDYDWSVMFAVALEHDLVRACERCGTWLDITDAVDIATDDSGDLYVCQHRAAGVTPCPHAARLGTPVNAPA